MKLKNKSTVKKSIALITMIFLGSVVFAQKKEKTTMHAQLITYELKDISIADYQKQMVEPDAPILAEVDGLLSKVWLANDDTGVYGGFYLWENKEAMQTFMNSDLVKAVVSRPFVDNISSTDYPVNHSPSLITRGVDQ